jgi:hypothetical protein
MAEFMIITVDTGKRYATRANEHYRISIVNMLKNFNLVFHKAFMKL